MENVRSSRAFAQALARAALPEAQLRLGQWQTLKEAHGPAHALTRVAGMDAVSAAQMGLLVGVLDPADPGVDAAREAAQKMASHLSPEDFRPDRVVDAFTQYNEEFQARPSGALPAATGQFVPLLSEARRLLGQLGTKLDSIMSSTRAVPFKLEGELTADGPVPGLVFDPDQARAQFANLQLEAGEALAVLKVCNDILPAGNLGSGPLHRLIGIHGQTLEAFVSIRPPQPDVTVVPRLRQLITSLQQGISLVLPAEPRPN